MKLFLENIELFRDLARFESGQTSFDFHNDFDFSGWSYVDHDLVFGFKRSSDVFRVELTFRNAELLELKFDNTRDADTLTIDTLYRGRLETNGELYDTSADGRFCIYFDFLDGFQGRFLCEGVEIQSS